MNWLLNFMHYNVNYTHILKIILVENLIIKTHRKTLREPMVN